jgi:hypothetical protein
MSLFFDMVEGWWNVKFEYGNKKVGKVVPNIITPNKILF